MKFTDFQPSAAAALREPWVSLALDLKDYSPQLAEPFIGKRVLVSICDIGPDGDETFSAFSGVIDSAHAGGLVVRVEGKGDDKYWVMPPLLDALVPAEAEAYEIDGYDMPVEDIDYVARFARAESVEDLPRDDGDALGE